MSAIGEALDESGAWAAGRRDVHRWHGRDFGQADMSFLLYVLFAVLVAITGFCAVLVALSLLEVIL